MHYASTDSHVMYCHSPTCTYTGKRSQIGLVWCEKLVGQPKLNVCLRVRVVCSSFLFLLLCNPYHWHNLQYDEGCHFMEKDGKKEKRKWMIHLSHNYMKMFRQPFSYLHSVGLQCTSVQACAHCPFPWQCHLLECRRPHSWCECLCACSWRCVRTAQRTQSVTHPGWHSTPPRPYEDATVKETCRVMTEVLSDKSTVRPPSKPPPHPPGTANVRTGTVKLITRIASHLV